MPGQYSKVFISNMALNHLNHGIEISSMTEDSTEAKACNLMYDTALGIILRAYHWPFATKQAVLNLVVESPSGGEWGYAYAYPSDCLMARRILGLSKGHSLPHDESGAEGRIPFKIAQRPEADETADVKCILTDEQEATMEYTKFEQRADRYPDDFALALSFKLAYLVAPRLTGGDKTRELRKDALELYRVTLAEAIAANANEEQPEVTDESGLSAVRGD
jgi:hypothetical protein